MLMTAFEVRSSDWSSDVCASDRWKSCDMHDPIPLTVSTGFLGSGKRTLLRNVLRQRGGSGIGVVVNELGEVGLDQDLLVHAAEHVELVAQGCMCCARRGDIAKALHDLIRRARRQGGSWIEEAIIEKIGRAHV